MVDENEFPISRPASLPEPKDIVNVMMTEKMARYFEQRCLGRGNTKGDTHLSGPVIFSEDDLPTYIIGIGEKP